MNGLLLVLISIVVLVLGYILYGNWLCKQWGVGENDQPTPAHTMEDGVDYVPAKAPVLMGHHFSSIAGAGPISGPINATIFGWLPCVLWILIGGIFFGGVHDFGALFASVRHGGKSIGEIISINMSKRAKRLFIIFAYLTLILVVAAFASIVADTFVADGVRKGDSMTETVQILKNEQGEEIATVTDNGEPVATMTEDGTPVDGIKVETVTRYTDKAETNSKVAMVSLLFIVVAIVFGFLVYRRNVPMGIATVAGVIAIALCVYIGLIWHPIHLNYETWMIIVGVYIVVASITPVWILLQPRDYLSSFLLYAMLALALVGVVISRPAMQSGEGEAIKGLVAIGDGKNSNGVQPIFPVLFTTIACGAISGFHSLVGSGTTSKQLDKEKDAKPIAYGGMLIECVLAVLTLVAIAVAKQNVKDAAGAGLFSGGIAFMIAGTTEGSLYSTLNALLTLTYSAFCLTSLDTATRMGRFMFQEFWLDSAKGETVKTAKGYKKILTNPLVATLITVVLGIGLGMFGWDKIWVLFGAANQLLAALALLAVATWLGNIGKNNKMFLLPMAFMLVVTIASLCITVFQQVGTITAGKAADWGPYAQAIIAVLLIVLSLVLAFEGVKTLRKPKQQKA